MEHLPAPEMSGALADNTVASQSVVNVASQRSNDYVISPVQPPKPRGYGAPELETVAPEAQPVLLTGRLSEDAISETKAVKPLISDMKVKKQRRLSFFVVPDNLGHGEFQNMLPERIEIGPSQRSSTFEIGKPKRRPPRDLDSSSLEAALRYDVNGPLGGCIEGQIPLPETREGSVSIFSESTVSHKDAPKSSLEVIAQHGTFPIESNPRSATLPLPDSPAEPVRGNNDIVLSDEHQQQSQSFLQAPETYPQPPPSPPSLGTCLPREPTFNYGYIKQRAVENFEHLKHGKFHKYSRHDNINIDYIDFFISGTSKSTFLDDRGQDLELRHELRDIPADTKQRLLVVEDISNRTIDLLGSLYGITPEFFEEHLINSGYEGPKYDDPHAQTWTTSDLKRSYASIKWYRPVWRLDVVPYSNRDLDDLLDPEVSHLKYTSVDSNDLVVYQTEMNIFRSNWGLWTDPKTTPRTKRVCGWEEKGSIWSHKLPGRDCYIIVLLLDPLSTLSEGIERVVTATRRVRDSNTSNFNSADGSFIHGGGSTENHHTIDAEEMARVAQHLKARNVGKKPPTKLNKFLRSLWSREAAEKDADTTSQLSQTYEVVKTKQVKKIRSRNIFEQIAPRARLNMDLESAFQSPQDIEDLRAQLYDTKSTKDCFGQWLKASGNEQAMESPSGVMTALFHILKKDTTSLLKILHRTLDDINSDVLDDMKMEDRLTLWRQLIIRAQDELPELKRSTESFFSFFEGQKSAPPVNADEKNNFVRELQDLLKQIDDIRRRLSAASASLTSNMALLESKRSIAEAQSVTKLTELAFFFIPLTFATSIFGMQIEQFENRAPLSNFIILGIAFTAFSYLIRLVIRSMWMRHMKEACGKSVKLYADHKRQTLQRGSVPASLFVQWIGHELGLTIQIATSRSWEWTATKITVLFNSNGSLIRSLFIVSIIVIGPVTVLWTRDMDHGTQAIVTVIILVAVIVLIIILPSSGRLATRSAFHRISLEAHHAKDISLNFRSTHPTIFKWMIRACLAATAIVPLALIWTKPVAPGIRAAVTTVIILTIVMGFISFGFYRLMENARAADSHERSSSMVLVED